MRDVWPGVKPGNVCDNIKSQEASQALKVPTRGATSLLSTLKTFLCKTSSPLELVLPDEVQ